MAQTEWTRERTGTRPDRAGPWAWGICWLMFASTVLNYMDRQAMALVGPQVKGEFHLNNADYGWVLAAFQLTYALFQVPAGYLVDVWDVRKTYAGAVAWWSLAGMAAAFSPTLGVLLACRALLGVGESFNWPCALRVTAQVLPPQDRSLGNGIFNSGAAVGAVLTPLIVTPIAAFYGWRTAFLAVGTLGLAWVVSWLALLGGEHRHRFAGRSSARKATDVDSELPVARRRLSTPATFAFAAVVGAALLVALTEPWVGLPAIWWAIAVLMIGLLVAALVLPQSCLAGVDRAESLGEVVRLPRFWIMVLVSSSINVCWHFLVNWLPTYLKEDRGMTFLASGLLSSVPFLAADFGNLGGGALARFLAGRGLTPVRSRMVVMALCTLLISLGTGVGRVRDDTLVMVLIALMALGTAAFMANYFSFTQEVSSRHTGLIVGILGGLGNLCAAGFLPVVGRVKDTTGSFAPIFLIVGLLPFVGLGALLLGWRPSRLAAKPD